MISSKWRWISDRYFYSFIQNCAESSLLETLSWILKNIILGRKTRLRTVQSIVKQYHENLVEYVAAEKELGKDPYPHKFHILCFVPEFVKEFGKLEYGERLEDVGVTLAENTNGARESLQNRKFVPKVVLHTKKCFDNRTIQKIHDCKFLDETDKNETEMLEKNSSTRKHTRKEGRQEKGTYG